MKGIESNSLIDYYHFVPLEVSRGKRKSSSYKTSIALKIPWLTILVGFFLSRTLLLDELLPFGIAFLAAVQKQPRLRSFWALLAVLAGYLSLAPFNSIYPYFLSAIIIWLGGVWKENRIKDSYWVTWIIICFLGIKTLLTLLGTNYPMIWIVAVSETLIALAGYGLFSSLVKDDRVYALNCNQFRLGVLLSAVLLGTDIVVGSISLRITLLFYLLLSLAKIEGKGLSFKIGPILALMAILLKLPIELSALIVVVSIFAGFLKRLPLGLFVASFLAYLLIFGIPVVTETVPYLIMLLMATILAYLTPTRSLNLLERLIPGTKRYQARQTSYATQVQNVLENRLHQFADIFRELATTLGDSPFTAEQLDSLAEIVEGLSGSVNTKIEFSEALEYKLWQEIDHPNLVELIVSTENNGYRISGSCNKYCGEDFCSLVAQKCGTVIGGNFSVIKKGCLVGTQCQFDICTKPRYSLDVKTVKVAQGEVSGDNNLVFRLGINKHGLLISDGMGTGERASVDSQAAIGLLEKMIIAGYPSKQAVEIVNHALLARSTNDSFATVDLAVVDLVTGLLEFIKIGACASFIKRQREIEVVQNHSLPVGILNHVEVEPERRLLQEGEYLIMVTDGILEFQREVTNKDEWMCNLLRRCDDDLSCEELANLLLFRSVEAANGRISDDMTVVVARLIKTDLEIHPYQRN